MDAKWTFDKTKGLRFRVTPCFIWWSWGPCVLFYTYMIFMVIFVPLLIKGSLKGPKKGVITDFTYSRAKILDTARLGVELTKHSLSSPEAISRMQNLTSN